MRDFEDRMIGYGATVPLDCLIVNGEVEDEAEAEEE